MRVPDHWVLSIAYAERDYTYSLAEACPGYCAWKYSEDWAPLVEMVDGVFRADRGAAYAYEKNGKIDLEWGVLTPVYKENERCTKTESTRSRPRSSNCVRSLTLPMTNCGLPRSSWGSLN